MMDYRVQIEIPFEEAEPHTREGRLERRLMDLVGEPLVLHCTDNRRTMISASRKRDALHVRIHRMFLRADSLIVNAIARYLRGKRDTKVTRLISSFIDKNRDALARASQKRETITTAGTVYDLAEIFSEVKSRYFADADLEGVFITWGRRTASRRRRSTIKLGTYNGDDRLIRIHPSLDQEAVPRYFVEYVIYHEILHHLIPVVVVGGRRVIHSEEFRKRERQYPNYVRALVWEARNIGTLMRGNVRL